MSEYKSPFSPPNVVTLIQNNKICIENISEQMADALEKIGAHLGKIAGETVWIINYADDTELAGKLFELNNIGAVFVGGPHGWPPAEIYIDLREKDFLKGKFKEVTWRGPGDWFIIER
jgi:hypothetical protein